MNTYKNCFINILIALLGSVMLFAACAKEEDESKNKEDESKSSTCDIVSFKTGATEWSINGTDIICSYPSETSDTLLTPTITLSPGATINPPANEAQNFFTPQGVTYTVTAEDSVTTKTYIAKATINAIASGVTGDCIWTITGAAENYTLTISGNGAMADYDFVDDIRFGMGWYDSENDPLYQWRSDIKTIVIHDGVTSIGDYAFSGCSITSISIPNSVTEIGNGAFFACYDLTSITIPNSVTKIGEMAFSVCHSLTSITIPNLVTEISDSAFYGCYSLISITIPNSVIFIGNEAFAHCWGLTSITIPNSVTSIGYSAFSSCSGLTSITIGSSVTSIGDYAFSSCSGLTSINVDAGNSNYISEDGVLFNKDKTMLIVCPRGKTGSYTIPNSITSIDEGFFLAVAA